MDDPVTQVLGIVGPGGRANLTPMWFDYEGDTILVNCAAHRTKTGLDPQEPAADQPAGQPGEPVSLGQHQAHGDARGLRGRSGRRASGSPSISTRSGRSTRSNRGRTVCATRRSTSGACCSSARSTRSPHSVSPDPIQPSDGHRRRRRIARRAHRRVPAARRRPSMSTVYERRRSELEERGAGIGFLPATYRYLVEHGGVRLDDDRRARPATSATSAATASVVARRGARLPVQLVEHRVPPAARLLRSVRPTGWPTSWSTSSWSR